VRSCPCIRAPARCRARRRCELPRWDRCRACLRISTGSYRDSRSQSGAARPRTAKTHSYKSRNWKKAAPFAATAIGPRGASIKMTMPAMTRPSERPIVVARGPHIPRIAQVGPQAPPAPPLRCARTALCYGAGPSYGLPGQSATSVNCRRGPTCRQKSADFDRRSHVLHSGVVNFVQVRVRTS